MRIVAVGQMCMRRKTCTNEWQEGRAAAMSSDNHPANHAEGGQDADCNRCDSRRGSGVDPPPSSGGLSQGSSPSDRSPEQPFDEKPRLVEEKVLQVGCS